ncbi:carbohydrate ABC transporter permease [Brachybacterium massiliense]|uniref:carbohydrate ABC transporter permease n=1 Tax=Brachybacterium massiliense TaxID=1755098 RepID=UPI000B3BC984|nr:carbohydrate ABC transporter permease [Brachybacterium massiliense]
MIQGTPPPGIAARIIKGIILTIACLLVIIPFTGVISTSLASPESVARAGGFVIIPDSINFGAYRAIFSGGVVSRAVWVSIGVTVAGTAISLAVTTMLAYALSRRGSVGQRPMLFLVLGAILFAPGMIPTYLVVKSFGLLDSYWALILPTAVSAFNVIVVRSFFMSIPQELIDSARVDGASEWMTFTRIVLPLSKAALAVIGLFYAVGYWNAFFNALLYMNDTSKWPLQLVLRAYVVDGSSLSSSQLAGADGAFPPQQSLQMAILVVSVVPILIVYPFLQKHFAKGVLTGAVKG